MAMNTTALVEENARLHRDVEILIAILETVQEHLSPDDAGMLASIKSRPGSTLDEGIDALMGRKG